MTFGLRIIALGGSRVVISINMSQHSPLPSTREHRVSYHLHSRGSPNASFLPGHSQVATCLLRAVGSTRLLPSPSPSAQGLCCTREEAQENGVTLPLCERTTFRAWQPKPAGAQASFTGETSSDRDLSPSNGASCSPCSLGWRFCKCPLSKEA